MKTKKVTNTEVDAKRKNSLPISDGVLKIPMKIELVIAKPAIKRYPEIRPKKTPLQRLIIFIVLDYR